MEQPPPRQLNESGVGPEVEALLRQLEVERARLASIFRHAPAFVALLRGPTHVFEMVNDAYLQLVGHRELVGKPAFEAVPDARDQGFEAMLDSVYTTGTPFVGREVPISLERTPGAPPELRFLDFTYLPLTDPDGARTGIVAYGLDVTDHVAARKEVEHARDRIAILQELTAALAGANTPQAVAEVVVARGIAAMGASTALFALRDVDDPSRATSVRTEGLPDDVRRAWTHFSIDAEGAAALSIRTGQACFITSRDELSGRFPSLTATWDALGAKSIAAVPMNAAGEILGAMSFSFTTERDFPPEDREFFYSLARQATLGLERARLIHALTRERELAVRARTEAELARAEWQQAASAKGQFLATMSHELRTPINAQIGYAQLLQLGIAGPLTADQREYLERLTRNSEHLLSLVNDVLDLSKIEARQLTAARDDLMTGSAVDSAVDVVRPLADARRIRLDDSRPNPRGIPYVGDEQRVRQVLVNLLSNAVKFTDPGGWIAVSCSTEEHASPGTTLHGQGPWAAIRVRDSGIGIEPSQAARIFEPFHQVHAGHTRTHGGTGLGLAISRRLARIMGGDLTVESELGSGSTFTLWLPAADASRVASGAPRESADDRRARADRTARVLDAPSTTRIAGILRTSIDAILTAYVDRVRIDPETPAARTMQPAEIEDHAASLLADFAQTLYIVSQGGPEAADLLRDGSMIQRTIAEHHGRRRWTQDWTEEATARDLAILREEVVRGVTGQLWATPDGTDVRDPSEDYGMGILLGLADQAAALSVRAWRGAAQR